MHWKREWTAVGVVSFGVGVAAGFTAKWVIDRKFIKDAEHVIDKMELFLAQAEATEFDLRERIDELTRDNEEGPTKDPNQETINFPEIQEDGRRIVEEMDLSHGSIAPVREAVFPEESSEWDWEVENQSREANPDGPFVIQRDEYEDDEADFIQSTLTYYQGDNILADDHDVPIYNHHLVVGDLKFGHGSDDPNIVYVRNGKLRAEYEIVLDRGHFSVEVLGQDAEDIEASFDEKREPRRFRPTD